MLPRMRKSTLLFVTFLLVVAAAWAQTRRPLKPVVISGSGERISRPSTPPPPPPPPPLSAALKDQLLKSLNLSGPGSLYVKLSVKHPFADQRGDLWFHNPSVIEGNFDEADWYNALDDGTRYVALHIKSEGAGHKYLFDCSVGASQEAANKGPFTLWRNQKKVETFAADEPHLVFLLDSGDNNWHEFRISGGPIWYFFGCEATRF